MASSTPHRTLGWTVGQLRNWARDQREREAWHDEDQRTYRYRAELLEAAVAHLTGNASAPARPPSPPKEAKGPISTRRIQDGAVHEMADRGVGTQCGLDLREPWEWTEEPVNCPGCLGSMALHRWAEFWMGASDVFRARGKPDVARWCMRRGAVWERRAVVAVQREHPERERTLAILKESARAMEEKGRYGW